MADKHRKNADPPTTKSPNHLPAPRRQDVPGITPKWYLADRDTRFFELELDAFVPERIYDAHIHLGPRRGFMRTPEYDMLENAPETIDMACYRDHLHWMLPDRNVVGANILPTTLNGNEREMGNAFAADQAAADEGCGSGIVVHPDMTADRLREEIQTYNPVSLKPYHLMSPHRPTMQSIIEDYLPEHLVAVAHEARLPIVLHIVFDTALADQRNQKTISHYCRKYPNMTMVLAHCARGLNPGHTVRGIAAVADLKNLFFDTSSICGSGAMEVILTTFGHQRLMWASDWPFSHFHGRAIATADTFTWLYDDQIDFTVHSIGDDPGFTFVSHESTRALKYACLACGLSRSQVAAIFHDNAAALFERP